MPIEFRALCSCDLDLDLKIFIYELDPYPLKCTQLPRDQKRTFCTSFKSYRIQTNRHTYTQMPPKHDLSASRVVTAVYNDVHLCCFGFKQLFVDYRITMADYSAARRSLASNNYRYFWTIDVTNINLQIKKTLKRVFLNFDKKHE